METSLGSHGSPSSECVDLLPWIEWSTAWIDSLGACGSSSLSAWMVALGVCGSPPFERMDGLPRSLGACGCALGVTLMGWLPRSPSGCQELWPNVCTLLRAHASQTSTKRAGDSAQAQRKEAQRPACVHLCSSAHCGAEVTESSTNKQHHLSLLQRFLCEVFKTPNYFRPPIISINK